MKRFKNFLRYSIIVSFLGVLLYCFITIKNEKIPTLYQEGRIETKGIIKNITIEGDKVSIILKAKEKLLMQYYLSSLEEKQYFETFLLGDTLYLEGTLKKPNPNTIFGGFNYRHYLYSNHIYWTVSASKITKEKDNTNWFYKIKNNIYNRTKNLSSKKYIYTFLLGDKSLLDDSIVTSYQKNGVSHLLAISGMHVSLCALLLEKIFHKMTKHSHLIISIILLFYLALADFSPSLVRAWFLFTCSKIPFPKPYLLLFLASCLLLYQPYYSYHLGFVFSFTISFYLLLFGKWSNQKKGYLAKLFITSVICFASSIPIMIYSFHEINWMTPILNLIFVPFVSFIVFPLSILTFIFPFLDSICVFFITILEKMTLFCNVFSISSVFSSIPFIFILGYYVVISWVLVYPKQWYVLMFVLLFHFLVPYIHSSSSLTMIDVGQGDCFLLEHHNSAVLIDTGGIEVYSQEPWQIKSNFSLAKSTIIPYLKSRGISALDALILTHGDSDHAKEAIPLLEGFKVKKVIMNSGNNNMLELSILDLLHQKKISYEQISNKTIAIGNITLQFINDMDSQNENEDSLIFITKINNKNILFMGDSGKISEKYLLDAYKLPKVDIVKVGHHGSKNSSSQEFIKMIQPNYAFISAKENNRYGHPHQEVLSNLEENGSKTYVTSIDGSVKINLKTLQINTCSKVYANGC